MTTTSASDTALLNRIIAGAIGGVVGGVVFGMLMQMMDMMGMVAQLIGSEAVAMGWLVHLFNSALFGAIFALLVGRWAGTIWPALGLGLVYGVIWWVLGALLIMPAWLGMSEMIFTIDSRPRHHPRRHRNRRRNRQPITPAHGRPRPPMLMVTGVRESTAPAGASPATPWLTR